jgi:hypothetical protein
MPQRVAASEAAAPGTPDSVEPLADAAAMAEALATSIERIDEALERIEPDGETPPR